MDPGLLPFDEAFARLRKDPEALPWPKRRELAQRLGDHLESGEPPETFLPLVRILADDPKGEVRLDIARTLVWLPDAEFRSLAAKLSEDPFAFARKAAERAIERRQKGFAEQAKRTRGSDALDADWARFSKEHGPAATAQAQRLAERMYAVLVGSAVHSMGPILEPIKHRTTKLKKLVQAGNLDTKAAEDLLTAVLSKVDHMERLFKDIRDFSRAPNPVRRRERLAALVREALQTVQDGQPQISETDGPLLVYPEIPERITIEVARDEVLMALVNTIKNAFEAFPANRRREGPCKIEISARERDGAMVEITIADNGIGIPADDLKEIQKCHPTGKTIKSGGTGFGLPNTQQVLRAHGGSLKIESTEDKGTTIRMFLPIEQPENA